MIIEASLLSGLTHAVTNIDPPVVSFTVGAIVGCLFPLNNTDHDEEDDQPENPRLPDQLAATEFAMETLPVIQHDAVRLIRLICVSNRYGLFVIGGPAGTGKTQVIRQALTSARNEGIHVRHVIGLKEDTLAEFGEFGRTRISDNLPPRTVLLIDQCDVSSQEFTSELELVLHNLTYESDIEMKFKVIVVVSDPAVYKTIGELDWGNRVHTYIDHRWFKWSEDEMMDLCGRYLPRWSRADRLQLVSQLHSAPSPSILSVACQLLSDSKGFPTGDRLHELSQRLDGMVSREEEVWKKFDDIKTIFCLPKSWYIENNQ